MRVTPPATPVKPACWNREPSSPVMTRHGIDQYTGEPIAIEVRSDWSIPGCATWAGRGIGSTPETTHYPAAHGWDHYCRTCRHLPDEGREAMGMTR